MLNKLKEIVELSPTVDYKELHKKGAVIVDVRREYASGNIKGSQNVPLPKIRSLPNILKNKTQPVIACQLKAMGRTQACNGWGRNSLQKD